MSIAVPSHPYLICCRKAQNTKFVVAVVVFYYFNSISIPRESRASLAVDDERGDLLDTVGRHLTRVSRTPRKGVGGWRDDLEK